MSQNLTMAPQTEQMDFLSNFMTAHRVPEDARRHFASVEWTNKHLSNPLYKAVPTFSRVLKESGEDYFFARTVSSPSTIPHLLTLQLKDFPFKEESARGQLKQRTNHNEVTQVPENPDCVMLL